MKTNLIYTFIAILLITTIISCKGSRNDDILTGGDSYTLNNSKKLVVIDMKHNGADQSRYNIEASDRSIARGAIRNKKIYIWGGKKGDASIQLKYDDVIVQSTRIKVEEDINNVPAVTNSVNMKLGKPQSLALPIKESEYLFHENTKYQTANAVIENSLLTITPHRMGATEITLYTKALKSYSYKVDVNEIADLVIDITTREIELNKRLTLHITSGNGNYKAKSYNQNIASIYISGYTGTTEASNINPADLIISGITKGTTQIEVTDKEGQKELFDIIVK